MPDRESLRMRKADPFDAPFHLQERLAIPAASVRAGKISLWVYRDQTGIREIVLSGHAESRTCCAATTCIMECVKKLGDQADCFLTCGAAHLKVITSSKSKEIPRSRPPVPSGEGSLQEFIQSFLPSKDPVQLALNNMVGLFKMLEKERGLIAVRECPWRHLEEFRASWRAASSGAAATILLPDVSKAGRLADYVPIIPTSTPDKPLVFRLAGWDFDDPLYQTVADMHLRQMSREILADAIRRRGIYRRWLREWLVSWVRQVHALPERNALELTLKVPSPRSNNAEALPAKKMDMKVDEFLSKHVQRFLDEKTTAHELRAILKGMRFGQTSAEELHRKVKPVGKIRLVSFEDATDHRERDATDEDARSLFDQIALHQPGMISECLSYIQSMDELIAPYESLRQAADASGRNLPEHADARLMDRLNRSIVIETMIRGWPSFFLREKSDREIFNKWAVQRREHVWRIMHEQAHAAGVSIDILLEDNVVYDVRFDDDLGCIVQPLMLLDDAVHAQVHGSRAGASVAVPLWTRQTSNPLGAGDSAVRDNAARAAVLVEQARRSCRGESPDLNAEEQCLRAALTCHPRHAGRLILEEWTSRLNTSALAQFKLARQFLEAVQLASTFRFEEAKQSVSAYLQATRHPVPDAIALEGLCEAGAAAATIVSWIRAQAREKTDSFALEMDAAVHSGELTPEARTRLADYIIKNTPPAPTESALLKWLGSEERRRRSSAALEKFQGDVEKVRSTLLKKYPGAEFESALRQASSSNDPAVQGQLIELQGLVVKREQALKDLAQAEDTIKAAEAECAVRVALIQQALSRPKSLKARFPALARAAAETPQILEGALAEKEGSSALLRGVYGQRHSMSSAFRELIYVPYSRLVELLGLLDALYSLAIMRWQIREHPDSDRKALAEPMEKLAAHLWLPSPLPETIKAVAREFFKESTWDRLQTQQVTGFLDDASRRCQDKLGTLQSSLNDAGGVRSVTARLVQVHFTQVFDCNYRSAFLMLLEAHPTLMETVGGSPVVLNDDLTTPPSGCRFELDARNGLLSCVSPGGKVPIVRFDGLKGPGADHLKEAVSRLDAKSFEKGVGPLVYRVLGATLNPPADWCAWRNVLARLEPEMVVVMSEFDHEACLLPEYSIPLSSRDQKNEDERLAITPMDPPSVDWRWANLGGEKHLGDWKALIPADANRVQIRAGG